MDLSVPWTLQTKLFLSSCARNAAGGEDVGIVFVLGSEAGSSTAPALCVLIPARLYLRNGNYPAWSRSFSLASVIS